MPCSIGVFAARAPLCVVRFPRRPEYIFLQERDVNATVVPTVLTVHCTFLYFTLLFCTVLYLLYVLYLTY